MLSSNLVTPEMSETSVDSGLLHSLEILSEPGVQSVGDELVPCSVSDVSLSVEEPLGNVIVYGKGQTVFGSYRWALA